jgi:hypothetical protein
VSAPLDKLHDFYQPPPPSWMPQTIGWYVVFAVGAAAAIWIAVHFIRKWLANRYRREALRELPLLPPEQISALLKRTALEAWPREKVASLSGDAWLAFLNTSAGEDLFRAMPASLIEELALRSSRLSSEEEQAVRHVAATWIRRHRVQA